MDRNTRLTPLAGAPYLNQKEQIEANVSELNQQIAKGNYVVAVKDLPYPDHWAQACYRVQGLPCMDSKSAVSIHMPCGITEYNEVHLLGRQYE